MAAAMNLLPGAFLRFFSGGQTIRDRLLINSGVLPALRNDYVSDGFIPKSDWRCPTDNEMDALFREPDGALPSEQIAVFSPPSEIFSLLSNVTTSIERYNDHRMVRNALTHGGFVRGRSKLVKFMERMGATDVRYLGHSLIGPGNVSTSIRPDGLHVGMHVDTYVHGTVDERNDGYPSRLCLNVGPESRYFQFINLTLRQMIQLMPQLSEQDPNVFAGAFLTAFQDYPVVQVEIKSGEAYVAPTEIMIHDGSTLGKKYLDTTITLLGTFGRSSIAKAAAYGAA